MTTRQRSALEFTGLLLLLFVATPAVAQNHAPPSTAPAPQTQPASSAAEQDPPPPETPPDDRTDWLEFRNFKLDDYELSPGEAGDAPLPLIEEAAGPRRGIIDVPFFTPAIESARVGLNQLYQDTGFRLTFAHTLLFQSATGGGPDRIGTSGDLDIMTDWTLIGRGTPNTGRLIATAEYRYRIGESPPSALAGRIGSLQNTTGGFNDRLWALRDLHYTQRLFEGRLILLLGRADVSDYVGGHRLQGINNSFSNRNFSADSTTAYPAGHVFTMAGSVRPIDEFYVTGGLANAYGTSTTTDLEFLDEGKFFGFGEFGFTPVIPGLGWGRYACLLWHMPPRDLLNLGNDWGFTVIAEQDLGERLKAFARYGWADDGTLTGNKQSGQVGVGYHGLLGSPLNLTGVAVGLTEPAQRRELDLDLETVAEVFHRFQVTDHSQLSVGFQSISQPSRSDDAWVGVFSLRYRIAF